MTIPNPKSAAMAGGTTAAEKSRIPILADGKKSCQGVRELCRRRRLRESAFWFRKEEVPDRPLLLWDSRGRRSSKTVRGA
jgi:hypothetical protein